MIYSLHVLCDLIALISLFNGTMITEKQLIKPGFHICGV